MTRASRLVLISLGILAIGSLGGAPAQEVEKPLQQVQPVNTALPPADVSGTTSDLVLPAPQPGPHTHYKTLLTTLTVPTDQATYGDFCDFGYWAGGSYAGHDGLPAGYWVYMSPSWFVYKDSIPGAGLPVAPRPWGAEQATGAPDTWPKAGDLTTAWAPQSPGRQPEWLELTYDAPIRPVAVLIYETCNPGAVDRVTAYNADGKEFDLWSGSDPTAAGSEKGISVIALHPEVDVTRIRVYLNSQQAPASSPRGYSPAGWNEIDAVGLLDAAGTTHWAKSATASSTYADVTGTTTDLGIDRLRSEPKANEQLSSPPRSQAIREEDRSSGETQIDHSHER
ncbi:MAG TPA: hypothetical protein VFE47_15675 [Tepidisphaeraceae bacterium]|jgi:hypothetical protein|nr:hypothetical protein [Tepidisphaeraceae bacterium]